ncbi:MAG: nuclear transport factor 2 family protein [Croceibacterium sp.]
MSAQDYSGSYASDRAEIEDLMARYLFALDYNDLDSFIAMFTDDAEFEFARGRVQGRDTILETVKGFKKRIGEHYKDEDGNPAVLRHVLAHTAIRVEGDRAWTRAQWFEMANDGPGKSLKMGTFGIYEDKLVRQDGRWLFAERRIMNEFLPGRESGPENPIRGLDAAAGA